MRRPRIPDSLVVQLSTQMWWIFTLVAVALLLYIRCVRPFSYWSKRGVSQYNVWTTWKESLVLLFCYRPPTETLQKYYDSFPGKRYIGIYQFYKPMLLLKDLDLIKQIYVKDFDHFLGHYNVIHENAEPLWTKNMFVLKGDKWRDIRSVLSPFFTSSKIKMMFGFALKCAEQVVEYFEAGPHTVEMKDIFTRYANDVVASTAFGVTCNSLKDRHNEFYLMGKKLTNFESFWSKIRLMLVVTAPKLAKVLGVGFFNTTASNYFRRIIKKNVEARIKCGIVRPDLINFLLEAKKEKEKLEDTENVLSDDKPLSSDVKEKLLNRELSDEDITAHAVLFFFAGFDTTSTVMAFMAYELAVHPNIQQRLQNEIDNTLKCCEGNITYESLMNMKYMDMVVSESLRKWPGGISVDRYCNKDYVINPVNEGEKPVHLKTGDVVWTFITSLHRDPQYFSNPDHFDPERFSDENKFNINPYAYIPFGSGPRSCVGRRFGVMEIKLVFFCILSKFNMKLEDRTAVPIKLARTHFSLASEGGIWLGLERRNKRK